MIIISALYAPLWRIHDSTTMLKFLHSRRTAGRLGWAQRYCAAPFGIHFNRTKPHSRYSRGFFLYFHPFLLASSVQAFLIFFNVPLWIIVYRLDASAIFDRSLMGNGSRADKSLGEIEFDRPIGTRMPSFSVSRTAGIRWLPTSNDRFFPLAAVQSYTG